MLPFIHLYFTSFDKVVAVLVLIDESGDCGLKFGRGSSDYFIVVAVVFSDEFSMGACDRTIDGLRRGLKKPSTFEFHFSHAPDKLRRKFLKAVNNDDFLYAGFVVDKRKLYGDRFRDPKQFYEFAVGIVCENVKQLLIDAKVIIDKNGDRIFRQQLSKILKVQMTEKDGTCRLKKVTMETSHSNNLLQLADMICGAVMRSYTGSDNSFRALIKRREKFVQRWPP